MTQQHDPTYLRDAQERFEDSAEPPPRADRRYTADDFLVPMWRGNPSAGERWWLLWRAFCTEPDDAQRRELSAALDKLSAEIDGLEAQRDAAKGGLV